MQGPNDYFITEKEYELVKQYRNTVACEPSPKRTSHCKTFFLTFTVSFLAIIAIYFVGFDNDRPT
jgi:hypothetical protein